MLPQIHRLKEKKDFRNLFRFGKRLETGPFGLVCLRNQLGISRFGIIVRKGFGSAVKRNRAKRVTRHMAADLRGEILPGCDIAVLPRAGFLDKDMEALKVTFKEGLQKLGVGAG